VVNSPLAYSPVSEPERYQTMTPRLARGLEVDRSDLSHTRIVTLPDRDLQEGQILVTLDSFSLTSNNVTYGLFGDALNYWKFFPSTEKGWGNIPVWGYATVEESLNDDIEPGERIYGLFPMTSSFLLTPDEVDEYGFVDGAQHRERLPNFYNSYHKVSMDRLYRADYENQQLLFRPLFLTAFMLDDLLASLSFYGVEQIVISSASSKTALALAWLLKQRDIKTVGITSQTRRAFVKNTQTYDTVILYDQVDDQLPMNSSVFLDFSGSPDMVQSIHQSLGEALKASYRVGATHWQVASPKPDQSELSGPEPKFFAATQHGIKLVDELGYDEVQRRVSEKLLEFYEPASRWIKAFRGVGEVAIQECYDRLLLGKTHPSEGYILSFDL